MNAILLQASLHGRCSKTQCQKILEALAEDQVVELKVNGKQKIYFPPQEGLECVTSEELAEMDRDVEAKKKESKALSERTASLASGA